MDTAIENEREGHSPGQPAAALGRTVGRGATWMLGATVLAKGAALVSQIVLGFLLSEGDFAVFGVAIALSGVVQVFRDGGVREVLIQRGPAEYPSLAGSVFYLAGAMNMGAAAVIAGLALALTAIKGLPESYGDPRLPAMLLVIALSIPLATPAAVLQAKLRLDLRFEALSRIALGSALVRNAAIIVLALWLKSPMAFVWPLVLVAVLESAWSYLATRDAPWLRRAEVARWGGLLRSGVWMIAQTLANVMLDVASFAVIGLIMPKEPVGLYVFAYTWIAQVGTLLGFALQQVLFPALVRLKEEPERLRAAVRRAQGVQMMLGAAASIGLAVVMDPLEGLIWQGRWDGAVAAVMILGAFFPFRVTFGLSTAVMMARGRFKGLAGLTAMEGVLVVGAGAAGAALHGSAEGVAWWTGGALLVGRVLCTYLAFRDLPLTFRDVAGAMAPPWILAVAAGAAVLWAEAQIVLGAHARGWFNFAGATAGARLGELARLLVLGAGFTALYGGLARLVLPGVVGEVCEALPGRLGSIARRAAFMRAGSKGGDA